MTRQDLQVRFVSLQKGRSGLLGGLKMVFRGLLFTPKMPLNPILTSSLTLGAQQQQQALLTSPTWCSHNLLVQPACLQTSTVIRTFNNFTNNSILAIRSFIFQFLLSVSGTNWIRWPGGLFRWFRWFYCS